MQNVLLILITFLCFTILWREPTVSTVVNNSSYITEARDSLPQPMTESTKGSATTKDELEPPSKPEPKPGEKCSKEYEEEWLADCLAPAINAPDLDPDYSEEEWETLSTEAKTARNELYNEAKMLCFEALDPFINDVFLVKWGTMEGLPACKFEYLRRSLSLYAKDISAMLAACVDRERKEKEECK